MLQWLVYPWSVRRWSTIFIGGWIYHRAATDVWYNEHPSHSQHVLSQIRALHNADLWVLITVSEHIELSFPIGSIGFWEINGCMVIFPAMIYLFHFRTVSYLVVFIWLNAQLPSTNAYIGKTKLHPEHSILRPPPNGEYDPLHSYCLLTRSHCKSKKC